MKAIRLACFFAALTALLILTSSQLAAATKPISFLGQPPISSDGSNASSLAIGDLNGDGILDLVITNACPESCVSGSLGVVSVLLGNGNGTFQTAVPYSTGAQVADFAAIGDVNGDGVPDLVVTNQCAEGGGCFNQSLGVVSVLLGNGDGTFQAAVPYSTHAAVANSVAIGDVNGDGIPDLVVANECMESGSACIGAMSLLLGNGDGTFQPPVVFSSGGVDASLVVIKDVNGDGKPDLVVSNNSSSNTADSLGEVSILLGNGDGTFQTPAPYSSGGFQATSVAISDVNGDGNLDLVVSNLCDAIMSTGCTPNGGVSVLLGNGDGTFQTAVEYGSGGYQASFAAVQDVNGDGKPDLVVANLCQSVNSKGICAGTGEVSVLVGNGDGTFQTPVLYSTGGTQADSVVIGDVNRDGRPDLVALNICATNTFCANGSARVLLNTFSAATTTVVTSSLNPAPINTPVTFMATVTSTEPVPNGTVVTFFNGTTNLGTGMTTNGVASLNTSFTKVGTDTIKATVTAGGFLRTSSGTLKQVVTNPGCSGTRNSPVLLGTDLSSCSIPEARLAP
jgi:FG-GAP-like repeat/Bacterial Ig-like domain (group 3)/FG-GAP repeat